MNVNQLGLQEIQRLKEQYDFFPKYTTYFQAKRKRARFEYNSEDNTALFIWRVSKKKDKLFQFETVPIIFIFTSKILITVI
ncbi:hypothetical protein FD46_GL000875 [Liquorilactobacillus oeni DSM 19972]|uniref:Uncharacterized protein n=1 Tax=Liquorilactobacillus oeni DSM 19972 TaxID=1423777 RepID=A0A0R1MLI9_9LACO|nr:hypothetical protein FD46_GL000875 [Liquorilactobacillus oeni DSM 19972]